MIKQPENKIKELLKADSAAIAKRSFHNTIESGLLNTQGQDKGILVALQVFEEVSRCLGKVSVLGMRRRR